MNSTMSTKTALVDELEKLKRSDVGLVISRAREGFYHDFESPIATPKVQLVRDLRSVGLEELARRVMNGDFDE